MARKPVAKSVTLDEMYEALPAACKNETVREICGMFIESRNELGFPFTSRALAIVVNKYDWSAEMLAASLLCAMERGWRGVFLPDGKMYSEYAAAYNRMLEKHGGETAEVEQEEDDEQPQQPAWDQPKLPWYMTLPIEERQRMLEQSRQAMLATGQTIPNFGQS